MRGLLEVRTRLCVQRFRQCAEADSDVADDAGIEPVVERETFGGGFDLQQGHAVGNVAARREPDVLEEGPADQQHEIGIAKRLAHLPGVAGQRLAVAGMAGREGRVMPQPFEPHGGADRFRQATSACSPPDLATSSPAMMAGFFDFRSSAASASTPAGSGACRPPQIIRRRCVDRGFLFQDVDRQRDEHRPLRPVGRHLERAPHDRRDLVGALDLHAPLRHGCGHRNEVVAEHRILEPHARVLLAGRHDHGRIGFQRPVKRADAVAEAGSDMQVGDGDASRCLRIKAGGADRDAFMQRHDVFELRKCRQAVEQRRLRCAGIAEDMTHAVRHKRFHQHTTSAHFSPSRLALIRFAYHRPGRRPWQPRRAICARAAGCVFRMALAGAACGGL